MRANSKVLEEIKKAAKKIIYYPFFSKSCKLCDKTKIYAGRERGEKRANVKVLVFCSVNRSRDVQRFRFLLGDGLGESSPAVPPLATLFSAIAKRRSILSMCWSFSAYVAPLPFFFEALATTEPSKWPLKNSSFMLSTVNPKYCKHALRVLCDGPWLGTFFDITRKGGLTACW